MKTIPNKLRFALLVCLLLLPALLNAKLPPQQLTTPPECGSLNFPPGPRDANSWNYADTSDYWYIDTTNTDWQGNTYVLMWSEVISNVVDSTGTNTWEIQRAQPVSPVTWSAAYYCKTGWCSATLPGFGRKVAGNEGPNGYPANFIEITYLDGIPLATNWGAIQPSVDFNDGSFIGFGGFIGNDVQSADLEGQGFCWSSNTFVFPLCYSSGSTSWLFRLHLVSTNGMQLPDQNSGASQSWYPASGQSFSSGGPGVISNVVGVDDVLVIIVVTVATLFILFLGWLTYCWVKRLFVPKPKPTPQKAPDKGTNSDNDPNNE